MEAKPRVVEFTGRPSREDEGDAHLVVDRETFVRVAGREPTADEKIAKGRYRLYWREMAALLRGKRKVRVKLTVQPL